MVLSLLGSWARPKGGWKLWAHETALHTLTLNCALSPPGIHRHTEPAQRSPREIAPFLKRGWTRARASFPRPAAEPCHWLCPPTSEGSSLSGHCSSLPQQLRGFHISLDLTAGKKGNTTINTARRQARKPARPWDSRHPGGGRGTAPYPFLARLGYRARRGLCPKLGQCSAHLPKAGLPGAQEQLSLVAPSPQAAWGCLKEDIQAGLALNTRPCKEPRPWEPAAGSPRSSYPLICSRGNTIQASPGPSAQLSAP